MQLGCRHQTFAYVRIEIWRPRERDIEPRVPFVGAREEIACAPIPFVSRRDESHRLQIRLDGARAAL